MGSFKLEFILTDGSTNTPLGGVTIRLNESATDAIIDTQITDQSGKVVFFIDQGSIKYTISKSAYLGRSGNLYKTTISESYNVTLYQIPTYEPPSNQPPPEPPQLPPKPGEIIPRRPGEYHNSYVGTRCEVVAKSMFNQQFWAYRDMYTGRYGRWESSYHYAPEAANSDPACFLAAPPTPADWQTGIEQQIKTGFDGLGKYISDGLKSAADTFTLGLLDLEARIKAWIADMILELLMKKLDEGVKDVPK